MKKELKRNFFRISNMLFSVFLSLAVFLSYKMPTEFKTISWKEISKSDIGVFCVIFSIVYIAVVILGIALDKIENYPLRETKVLSKKWIGFIFVMIFLLCFFPFLAFYPGNLSPDSYSSINQAMTQITSTAHPVLFTLFVKICLEIGLLLFHNMNAAIATFSIVQMLMLDGILTYTVWWLMRHSVPRILLGLTVAYYALNPLICRYSFTMWKDILFSGTILLLVLFLYDLVTEESKSLNNNYTLMQFVTLSILVSFLRNRIVYAVMFVFLLLIIVTKGCRKKLVLVFGITGALILVIQGPVYHCLNIKASNFAEGQGVSLQQIGAVVSEGGKLSEEEWEFIDRIIPLEDMASTYRPGTVDVLKGCPTFDHDFLNSHSEEYVRVWRGVVLKNPGIALKAWLMNTRGFWGFNVWMEPFAITWPSEEYGIYQVNFIEKYCGFDLAYISNGLLVHVDKVPVVRRIFELGTLGWLGVYCCVRLIQKRRNTVLLALLPLNALWVVLIFTTPVFFELRYMFSHYLALPVMLCLLLMGDKLRIRK